jgi:hypothetical protein
MAVTLETRKQHVITISELMGDDALSTWSIESLRENIDIYKQNMINAINYNDAPWAAHCAYRVAQINAELASRANGYMFRISAA